MSYTTIYDYFLLPTSVPALVDRIPSARSSSRAFLISRILDCGMGGHPLASLAMPACPGPPLGRRRRWGRPKGFPRLCKCAWSRPRTYLQLYFIINSMICPQVLKPHALFTSICIATTAVLLVARSSTTCSIIVILQLYSNSLLRLRIHTAVQYK